LRYHIDAYAPQKDLAGIVDIDLLKAAFTRYRQIGMIYAAAITGEQIAQFYEGRENTKLAAKFLQEAVFLADSLGNHKMVSTLRESYAEI
jgi:hypothetical protein